jgi:carbamoyl-phosphate synthase large subunit
MREGETESAKIIYDEELKQLGYNVGQVTKHIGNLDIDVMKGEDGINYIIDINPRFGGHYPFAHEAGANVPAAIINWCRGLESNNSWLKVSYNKSFLKELVLKEIYTQKS